MLRHRSAPPNRLLVTAAFLVPLAAQPALAQDAIVITGSRTASDEANSTLIPQVSDRTLAAPSLTDVLDGAPGVRAFRKGGIGGSTYLALRGGEPNYTAVYLDGALVNDPANSQGGGFDLSQISPLFIETLGIVPGALSAVYGSEALAGAVFIAPRRGEGAGFDAAFAADTDGGFDAAALASTDGVSLGANLYRRESERQGSRLKRRSLFASAGTAVAGAQLSATLLYAETDRLAFPEDSGGAELAVNRERERREGDFVLVSLRASADKTAAVRPFAKFAYSHSRADTFTPAIVAGALDGVPAIASDTRFSRFESGGGAALDVGPDLTLAGGAEYTVESADSEGAIDFGVLIPADFALERGRLGIYAEATWRPADSVRLTGAVRRDDPDDLSAEWTMRLSGQWQVGGGGPTLFASFAEGYRLPSVYALAYPLIANPSLLPERSQTYEIGAAQTIGDLGRVRLSLFKTDYTDLIDFEPSLFTNVNRSKVETRGAEVSAQLRSGPWQVDGQLSYLDVDGDAGAPPLRSRPQWQGSARLTWAPGGGWRAALGMRAVAESFDSSVPTGLTVVDGYALFDLSAQIPLFKGIAADAGVRNLFDADYRDSVGVPGLGTTAYAGLRLSL